MVVQTKKRGADPGLRRRGPALAILLAALAAASLAGRLFWSAGSRASLPADESMCVAVELDGDPLGIACALDGQGLVQEAIARLGLPASCSDAPPSRPPRPGDLLRFSTSESDCSAGQPRRAAGPLRLLCGGRVDPNRDPPSDLELLPRVGPVKAGRIVESRRRDGPFETTEDLRRVRGIGPRTVEILERWVEISRDR
ncbi:MAG: helix-hairpin-helix domain-containing protein [Polyangia bacterium]